MEKSVDAFRTISEVADDLQLPQHVLRFWETRFAQIRPLKRAGGRRYYRPADVVLLRSIRRLLYDEGYTIKGVQRLLKDRGVRLGLDNLSHEASQAAFDSQDSDDADVLDGQRDALIVEPVFKSDERHDDETMINLVRIDDVDGASLREALAMIEECERILHAIRPPPS